MTYYLNAVHIDWSQGTPKASVNVSTKDELTGTSAGFDRAIPSTPGVDTKLNSIGQDVIAYIAQKHPGVTLQIPPVQVNNG